MTKHTLHLLFFLPLYVFANPKRVSLDSLYIASWKTGETWDMATVTNIKTGAVYTNTYVIKNGIEYPSKFMITGYDELPRIHELYPSGYFQIRFADCKVRTPVIPYTGNTIIKTYSATFKK